jgi:hypothetical protein
MKSIGYNATTTLTDVYTCPADTTTTFMFIQSGNRTNNTAAEVTVVWYDASTTTEFALATGTMVSPTGAVIIIKQLVLEEGDKIRASGSVAGILNVVGSFMEQT